MRPQRFLQLLSLIGSLLLILPSALSVEVVVRGKQGETLSSSRLSAPSPSTVGSFTLSYLTQEKKLGHVGEFEADADGVYSIDGLQNEVEIVSGRELKAWGWCFELNGIVPETMPAETQIRAESDRLVWYYGYAHWMDNKWIAQCVPGDSN